MPADSASRYASIVARSVETAGAADAAARAAVYDRLRAANLRSVESKLDPDAAAAMRRLLEQSIADHESAVTAVSAPAPASTPAAAPALPGPPASQRLRRWMSGPLAVGLLIGAAIGGVGTAIFRSPTVADSSLHDAAKLDQALSQSRPHLDAIMTFLGKVRTDIEARQQADPWGVEDSIGRSFKALKAVSPALDAAAPKPPGGGSVIVAATADGYKILFVGPLCAAAKLVSPELIDPVRDNAPVGCSQFGLWNDVGARF